MTSVLTITKQLKTGPKQYRYNHIKNLDVLEYFRQQHRNQYREKQKAKGYTVREYTVSPSAKTLANKHEIVEYIKNSRENDISLQNIGQELGVSRYKIERICQLRNILWTHRLSLVLWCFPVVRFKASMYLLRIFSFV